MSPVKKKVSTRLLTSIQLPAAVFIASLSSSIFLNFFNSFHPPLATYIYWEKNIGWGTLSSHSIMCSAASCLFSINLYFLWFPKNSSIYFGCQMSMREIGVHVYWHQSNSTQLSSLLLCLPLFFLAFLITSFVLHNFSFVFHYFSQPLNALFAASCPKSTLLYNLHPPIKEFHKETSAFIGNLLTMAGASSRIQLGQAGQPTVISIHATEIDAPFLH